MKTDHSSYFVTILNRTRKKREKIKERKEKEKIKRKKRS